MNNNHRIACQRCKNASLEDNLHMQSVGAAFGAGKENPHLPQGGDGDESEWESRDISP